MALDPHDGSAFSDDELGGLLLASIVDYAIFAVDANGFVRSWNPGAERLLGYGSAEILGKSSDVFFTAEDLQAGAPQSDITAALTTGRGFGDRWHVRKDGSRFWAGAALTPLREPSGRVRGFAKIMRDRTEWKLREEIAAEQSRLAAFIRDIGLALIQSDSLPDMLARCAESTVRHLHGAFARIWTLNAADNVLELKASAGLYTHLDGPHCRVPVGKFKIGLIALERKPHLTNAVIDDPRVSDQAWARREGMIAFAGYPLIVNDRVVGVLAMFARHALTEVTLEAMASVAHGIALGIERKMTEFELRRQREWQWVTLASIGDAVITTDTRGHITFLNGPAQVLTGWSQEDAAGQPLSQVFKIVNEETGKTVASPVDAVLKEGRIVGLANHTILIAKDGATWPIDDSAAPIRDSDGVLLGVVLVFHDVSAQRKAQNDLRQSEARKGAILETALDCVVTMDHQGTVVEFNPAAERTFGYRASEALGRELASLIIPPAFRESHRKGLARYMATGEGPVLGKRLELSAVRADGSEFPCELAITRISSLGSPLFTAYLRDISERKIAENALKSSEKRFRGLMEQAPFSVQVFTPEGKTSRVNKAWEELWGVTLAQVADYNILQDRQLEAKGVLPYFQRAFSGEAVVVPDIFYDPNETIPDRTRLEDRARWVSVVAYPLKDEAGAVREVVLVHEDITARKRAEKRVSESEENLRLLADTIPQLTWMARPDGHIYWYNRRWYEYTGKTPQEMEGWGWQTVHDPDTLPKVLVRWKASIATGNPFDMVFPLRRADGVLRPFLTRVMPLRAENGDIIHWFGTNTDITELKEAREALATSEERLRLALHAGRMEVWDWNIQTNQILTLESPEALFGLPHGKFDGTLDSFQKLIHRDDRELVNAAIRTAVVNGSDFDVEFRNVWPDGSVHWMNGKGKVFDGGPTESPRMIGIGIDVTARKRAEQTALFLSNASAALAGLVDFNSTLQKVATLAVPFFADWVTVDLLENDGTMRRVAVAYADSGKVELTDLFHRRLAPDFSATQGVWNILRTGKTEIIREISDEYLTQSVKDPGVLRIMRQLGLKSYIGVPLKLRGKVIGVLTFIAAESAHYYDENDLAVAQDLADRAVIAIDNAEMYQELRAADRRKDEFLATLAHELRNPLAPIRSSLQVLKVNPNSPDTAFRMREIMERQVQHLIRMVDDLMDVSRVMRGKIELRKENVELASVVARAVETAQPLIDSKQHTLEISMPSDPLILEGDPVRLTQIIGNLLINAAKYTELLGHIGLNVALDNDEIVLSIRDSGIGIALETLPRIFELFVQADYATNKSQGGLGIGLTLVKNLVELHGGSVTGRSEGLGKGSEFVVRLPMTRYKKQASNGDPLIAQRSHGHKVLVVDDNKDAAECLAVMLRLEGHDLRVAHSGPAALELAKSFHPAMIFLDIGMPGMDGYEVARRIRENPDLKDIVLTALTGWGQEDDRRRTAAVGFDNHLVKPPEPDALLDLLRKLK